MLKFHIAMVSSLENYYFGKKCMSFIYYLTDDYGCCSQWSVIRYAQFFFNYLFLFLDKNVYCLNFTLQWSPVSKSTILERNVWVLFYKLTGDYGCCSQWSVIRYAQFFFNYLFLFFDQSVYCLNFTLLWSPVSRSTILETNVWVLFIT